MIVLALDTSTDLASVVVASIARTDGDAAPQILARRDSTFSNAHGESLLPLIDAAIRDASLAFAQIDLIAVGVGPGSFTGTRIGVASAKGIAIATGKPLRGIDAFAAVARRRLAADRDRCGVAIDARKGEIYAAIMELRGGDVALVGVPSHLPPARFESHFADAIDARLPWFGDGAPLVASLAAAIDPTAPRDVPTAIDVAILAALRHARAPVDECDLLEPLYVRAPDITVSTRALGVPRPVHVSSDGPTK